ncbi:MAG: hypothetical protein AB1405_14355 [Bdellovibrionota bacterium]
MAPPPDPLVFFTDRDVGRYYVPEALRKAGETVKVHADEFPEETDDATWLRVVGRHGWIVLTNDKKIRKRPNEIEAVREAKVRMFAFGSGNLKGEVMAEQIVKALPEIKSLISRQSAPFIANITEGGRVRLIRTW